MPPKKNKPAEHAATSEAVNDEIGSGALHGSMREPPPPIRWLSLLKTGEGCVASINIDIQPLGPGSLCAYGSVIIIQIHSNGGSFKTRLLETREITSPSRAAAEQDSLRKALEMCVDYMGR